MSWAGFLESRLKVNQSINFSWLKMFFYCLGFVWFELTQVQNTAKQKGKQYKQKISPESYQAQVKSLAYPGLA